MKLAQPARFARVKGPIFHASPPVLSALMVEDSILVRQGLRRILCSEFGRVTLGEARDETAATVQLARRPWDLVILSVGVASKDGFEVLRKILARFPGARVLAMSPHSHYLYALRARQLGAAAYIGNNTDRENFVTAIRTVREGKEHFKGFELPENILEILPKLSLLSEREFRVLLALYHGERLSDIATANGLSLKTVSTYKRRILDKMGLGSTSELVRQLMLPGAAVAGRAASA
jgi:DNA-binding NarL/FixJ family response regulator